MACLALAFTAFKAFVDYRGSNETPISTISDDEMMRNFHEEKQRINMEGEFLENIDNKNLPKEPSSTIVMPSKEDLLD